MAALRAGQVAGGRATRRPSPGLLGPSLVDRRPAPSGTRQTWGHTMRTSSRARQGLSQRGQTRHGGLVWRLLIPAMVALLAFGLVAVSTQAMVTPDSTAGMLRQKTPPAPSSTPAVAVRPAQLLWPPGTTADTYRFTTVTKTFS